MPQLQQVPAKYLQIAGHIRDRILSGELAPGDPVPSERALAVEWGVARPTATKALEALRLEGLVAARQGAATVVLARSEVNRRPRERYTRARKTGSIYAPGEHSRILVAELVDAPAYVQQALGLMANARVVRRARVILQGEDPVEVSTSWFSELDGQAAPLLLARERILQGTIAYLESVTGRVARTATDRISAREVTEWEAEQLGIAAGAPVLAVHHVALDSRHQPLEFAEAVYPPGAWTFEQESSL